MAQRFYMVDVFAEQRFSGNQLAVVVGAETLPEETMQQFAAEMNFSETTFVTSIPEGDGGYRVRIFTPAREIAFTGHPILGTAWVIRHHLVNGQCPQLQLNLAVGQVPVTFETSTDGQETAWFLAPPMTSAATAGPEPVAAALGLSPEDIETRTPIQVVSAGTAAMIVPLRNLDALRRSQLDLEAYAPLLAAGFPPLVYLFSTQTHQPRNDLCARFFFEAHGVREDPATGNGAAFLGHYLLAHRFFAAPALSLQIEQGYEVRRQSLILLRARTAGGEHRISVGGRIIPVAQGELL